MGRANASLAPAGPNSIADVGRVTSDGGPQPHVSGRGKRIFLSYGRDEYTRDALRIKTDLEARGHLVWFDAERLREGRDWEAWIEQGLRHSELLVLLMTPHSVRRRNPRDPQSRDGYCLNEVAAASSGTC